MPKYLHLRNSPFVLFIVSHFFPTVSGYKLRKKISHGTKVLIVGYSSQLDLCPLCSTVDRLQIVFACLILEKGLNMILHLDSIILLLFGTKNWDPFIELKENIY